MYVYVYVHSVAALADDNQKCEIIVSDLTKVKGCFKSDES